MCIGLKERCIDCGKLTKQIVTQPCKAGSRFEYGQDLLIYRDSFPQCNAGAVDYTERSIAECGRCFRIRRSQKLHLLHLAKPALEEEQYALSRDYWPSDDVVHKDQKKARLARVIQAKRTEVAISLQHIRRQFNALSNAMRRERQDHPYGNPDGFVTPGGHFDRTSDLGGALFDALLNV